MSLWDRKAGWYDGVREWPLFRCVLLRERESLRRLARDLCRSSDPVLDMGAGTGASAGLYPGTGEMVEIGVDRSRAMAGRFRRNTGGPVVVADVSELPFRTRCTDRISVIGLMEYLRKPEEALRELFRVCKPGGCCLVTIARRRSLNRFRRLWGHRLNLPEQSQWEALALKAGFRIGDRSATLLQVQYRLESPKERI